MRRKSEITNKVNISCATIFVGKMGDFLSNDINKQAIIHLIADCLREKGCNVINSAGDADVDIVKAAVTMAYNTYRGRYRSAMFTTVSQYKWLYGPLLSI